jgi:SAM-dependent methyltransferase
MDIWKYYDITHKKHSDLNPMSKDKLEKLFLLLDLMPNSRVLDIGCGKGESLIRLVEFFNISGVGVDLSPYHSRDCKENINKRVSSSDIKILEMDGAKYKPDANEAYDLSMCLGASWIYNGFKGTIEALRKMTKPEGLIIVGEPYWLKEPDDEYLKMSGIKKKEFNSHYKNIDVGEKEGLYCVYTLVSNHDDWDHYETLQWLATMDYITDFPDDQDNPELLKRIKKAKMEYLLYGRDTIGWAIYVFKRQ